MGIHEIMERLGHQDDEIMERLGHQDDEIMERLGHQDDEITKRVYLNVTKTMKKEASKKFSELMKDI